MAEEKTIAAEATAEAEAEMNEAERRLSRAQRFGYENEETKKLARAARFGLPTEPEKPAVATKEAAKAAPAKKKSSELSEEDKAKIAARAARFGIPTAQADETKASKAPAAKENKSAQKPSTSSAAPPKKTSQPKELTLDEIEKIKARAERFGALDSAQYLHALEEEKRLKRAARFSVGELEGEKQKHLKADGEATAES